MQELRMSDVLTLRSRRTRPGVARGLSVVAAGFVAVGSWSCSSDLGPRDPAMTQLSFSGASTDAAGTATAADNITMTIGGHTLVVSQVQVTLDRAELERTGTAACFEDEDEDGDFDGRFHDRDCAEVKIHTAAFDLPLGGGLTTLTGDTIPPGTYRELELKVTKLRIVGTFDNQAFDENLMVRLHREIKLDPPLVVTAGTPVQITVNLPVARWFTNNDGSLLDPRLLLTSPTTLLTFKLRLLGLFRAFQDHDRDGRDDHRGHG